MGGGTEEVEQLEDETATVVITLHSFQAAATFKGCFGYQKGWKALPRYDIQNLPSTPKNTSV